MIPRIRPAADPNSWTLARVVLLSPAFMIVLVVWLGMSAPTTSISVPTEVSGIIRENAVWTIEKSPYLLTDKIQVSEGVTLTVEPGVTINGDGHEIQVWGVLEVKGTIQNRVIITDTHVEPGTNQYDAPRFAIKISGANIVGGSVYRQTSNAIYGKLTLTDSILRKTTDPMYLWYPTSPVNIERNVFDNAYGIIVLTHYVITIQNNVFFQQVAWYSHVGAINLIAAYGVEPVIRYNSFLSTDRVAIWIDTPYTHQTVDATNNFWNSLERSAVEDMIFDHNDDLAAPAEVVFEPFLGQPHAKTPSVGLLEPTPTFTPTPTNTPTSTPTPTPTATPLTLLLPSLSG